MISSQPYVEILNNLITLLHTQLNKGGSSDEMNRVLMDLQNAVIKLENILNKETPK